MFKSRSETAIEERTQAGSQNAARVSKPYTRFWKGFQFMFRLSANKISAAASALLLCAGLAQAQTPTPLTATWTNSPAAVALTFNLTGNVANGPIGVTVTATSPTIFDIDPTTVPYWLTLTNSGGTAITGGTTPNVLVNFQANTATEALGVGNYGANIHFKVSGDADLVVPVALAVTNGVNTVSVAQGTTIALTWVYGAAPPTQVLTIVSSAQPAAFSVTTANTTVSTTENIPSNWISSSAPSGIAYTFGTPITISFLSDVLKNAAVGASLTGTVTITPGSGSAITVDITITVGEPAAVVSGIFPAAVAPSTTTALALVVTGSGFTSSATTCAPAVCGDVTTVTIGYTGDGGSAVSLTGTQVAGSIHVVNPNTMVLTIPAMDAQSPTASNILAAGTITLTITNGLAGETAQVETLTVTSNPIITSITDAASLVQATPPNALKLAPYELISIFGNNFNLTALGAAGTAVAATTNSFGQYPESLDVPTGGANPISVSFYKQGTIGAPTLIGTAPLVYISNTQINAIVPSGVTASGITALQIVVTYGANSNATPYPAVPIATNPGVFTVGADGQGQGAILNSDYSINSPTNVAATGSTVMLYLSGLGAPNSTSSDAASTTVAKFPGSCISPASYFAAVNALVPAPATPWTSDDGAVILVSNLGTNKLPPCFTSSPSVTIGGKTATVTYAGWVADSVAGLYQVNVTVPTVTASTTAPVLVTMGGVTSQAGVTMAVQ
jgi:uncharacterized protein (TIGR03437 family)